MRQYYAMAETEKFAIIYENCNMKHVFSHTKNIRKNYPFINLWVFCTGGNSRDVTTFHP